MPSSTPRIVHPSTLVSDVQDLCAHVSTLRALLQIQRECVTHLEDRLYPTTAAGAAARRLMAVKAAERGTPPG